MSRRKIRRRPYFKGPGSTDSKRSADESAERRTTVVASHFLTKNPQTGETLLASIGWEVDPDKTSYMPIYSRAHELLPRPRSRLVDPDEYRKYQAPAIELLSKATKGRVKSDDILRALGILGHSPNRDAIEALSRFASSGHSLAPVAHLALDECTGLFSFFRGDSASVS